MRTRRRPAVVATLVAALLLESLVLVSATTPAAYAAEAGQILPSQQFGWTEGEFAVSEDGAATYRLPLWVPRGRGGLQASLALTYSSRGGNGPLGVGWSLQGLSSIAPCPRTLAQDGVIEPVRFAAGDAYCLDGSRLMPDGAPGPTQARWRTERDMFARVLSFGAPGAVPNTFQVWTKEGLILTYGEQTGSIQSRLQAYRLQAGDDPEDPSLERPASRVTVSWGLSSVADRNGNVMTIDYRITEDPNDLWAVEMLPETISYGPDRTVRFNYVDRTDVSTGFDGGIHTRMTQRLNSITMSQGPPGSAELLREYRLGYRDDSITERSLLETIAECDGGNVCLEPVEFTWSPGSYEFDVIETGVTEAGTHRNSGRRIYPGDVNGDGRDDIVFPDALNHWGIARSTGDNFGEARPLSIPRVAETYQAGARPVDFDRDGRMDLMVAVATDTVNVEEYALFESTGTDYERYDPDVSPGINPLHPLDPAYFLDLDGNGLPDYVTPRTQTPTFEPWHYALNTGQEGAGRFAELAPTDVDQGDPGWIHAVDTDGDGRTELLLHKDAAPRWESFGLDSAGEVRMRPLNLPTTTTAEAYDPVHFADVNGDGLADAVYPFSGLRVQLNSGNGFGPFLDGPEGYVQPTPKPLGGHQFDEGLRMADFNGDGADDVLVLTTPGVHLYTWTGSGFERADGLNGTMGVPTFNGWAPTQPLDIDGDGMLDMIHVQDDHLRLLKRVGGMPDKITAIGIRNVGPRAEIEYATLARGGLNVPHVPLSCSYPQVCPTRGGVVVERHRLTDGLGGWNLFTHQYRGARVDLHGRGWLGFESHTVNDLSGQKTTHTTFDNQTRNAAGGPAVYPFAGLPKTVLTTVGVDADTVFRQEVVDTNVFRRLPVTGTHTVERRMRVQREWEYPPGSPLPAEPLRLRTMEWQYDDFGNAFNTIDDMLDGRKIRQELEFENNVDDWLIGKLRRQETIGCNPQFICVRRTAEYHYYPNGNLREHVIEPQNDDLLLRTAYEYGSFGNVSTITRSDAAGEARAERFGYDDDSLYQDELTNPLGQTTQLTTDSGLGAVLTTVDANGNQTGTDYDGFGRVREVRHADGRVERIDYVTASNSRFVRTMLGGGGGSLVSLDALGRAEVEGVVSFDGRYANTYHTYDGLGRLATQSRPTRSGEEIHTTTFAYDYLNRLVSRTEPDGAQVRHSYEGLEIHTFDALDNHSYVELNVNGDVQSSFEDDPESDEWLRSRFDYGFFGELTGLESPDGTQQGMGYDLRGRRERISNPSGSGTTETTYNAFDEVTSVTNGAGETTEFRYDALGRVQRVITPAGTAVNTWDTAPNGIGKIANARSVDGVGVTYRYDDLSRPATTTWNIEGTQYELAYGYDEFGRAASLTYPAVPGAEGRFAVTYAYTPSGYLLSVTDPTAPESPIWTAVDRDSAGELTEENLGANIVGEYDYDPRTGLLDRATTTGPADIGTISSIGYGYDRNRNVTGRSDDLGRIERFDYDELDRIVRWGTVPASPGQVTMQATYDYDAVGNLEAETFQVQGEPRQDVVYGYDAARSHLMTSRNSTTYSYDGAGRQVTGLQRTVSYNHLDLPTELTWGQGRRTEYRYDATGARVLKRDDGQTVVYVPELFERRTPAGTGNSQIHNLHNIVVDGRVVAQVNRIQAATGGPVIDTRISYLHVDGLGSTMGVVNPAGRPVGGEGTFLARMFYDPFGRRIDAGFEPLGHQRHGGPREGYTGHEHDDEYGLVNMQGRMYDPEARRFLTPDPVVADPEASQTHNRYAYVQNNPATLTDPTGLQTFDWRNSGCSFGGYISGPACTAPDEKSSSEEWQWESQMLMAQERAKLNANSSDDGNSTDPAQVDGEVIVVTPVHIEISGDVYWRENGKYYAWYKGFDAPSELPSLTAWYSAQKVSEDVRAPGKWEQGMALMDAAEPFIEFVAEQLCNLNGVCGLAMDIVEVAEHGINPLSVGQALLPGFGKGGRGKTRLGFKRNNRSEWRKIRDSWDAAGPEAGYGQALSRANRIRIKLGRTPRVDDAWISVFPGDVALKGERINIHHIQGLPFSVPLPFSRHKDAHMPGGFRHNPGGPGMSG